MGPEVKRWEPIREIEFAAKFGFLSRRIWNENFCGGSKSWRNKKWALLQSRGYFRRHPAALCDDLLVLSASNPLVWKVCIGEPVRAPNIAQVRHDEILALGVMKLVSAKVTSSFQTDAELRRIEYSSASDTKLPDLIVEIGPRRVAIELELTQKAKERYRKMVDVYSQRDDLTEIIFVVPSKAVMDAIMRAIAQGRTINAEIGFMKLPFWENDPVDSQIAFKKRYATLRSLNKSKTGAGSAFEAPV